jgi:hypothetical protein
MPDNPTPEIPEQPSQESAGDAAQTPISPPEMLARFRDDLAAKGLEYERLAVFWPSMREIVLAEVTRESRGRNLALAGRHVEVRHVTVLRMVQARTPNGMALQVVVEPLPFLGACPLQICHPIAQWFHRLDVASQAELLRVIFVSAEQARVASAREAGLVVPG